MEQLTARNIIAAVTALAIIIVVGLGFVIRAGVNEQAQAQDLVTIAQGLQAAYANQSYAYGAVAISSSVLTNSGKVDPTIVSGTTINSRWQTAITLTGAGAGFTVALTGIPYSACTALLTDQSLGQYATSFTVDTGAANTVPVTPTTAATACTASGTHSITIAFAGHP